MPLAKIDTAAEEYFISDIVSKIKKQFRPLLSVKAKWFIHRILPVDTVLVEWKHRGLQELEIDISQTFTTREKLEQLLWFELSLIRDQIDPLFGFSHDYVLQNYGPDSPRQRYFPLIKTVWGIYASGQLYRMKLPSQSVDIIKPQFLRIFGNSQDVDEWFKKLYSPTREYTFADMEKIARTIYRSK